MKCMPLPPPPDLVLSNERWSQLSDEADRKGVHRSEIIGEAISLYLDNLKKLPAVEESASKTAKSHRGEGTQVSHDFDLDNID